MTLIPISPTRNPEEVLRYLAAVAPGATEVRTGPSAALPVGSVRVLVEYAGICHSDTAGLKESNGPFPYRMGHEVSGTVIESADHAVPDGSRVIAYVGDGYATEVVTAAENLVVLDAECTLLDGALAEPLACVIGAVEMLDLTRVDHVMVVGAGFMGLLTVGYLTAAGHRVTVVEPRTRTRELSIELGAQEALDPAEARNARLPSFVVIEATGTPSGLALASDLVSTGGTLGIMGYHQSEGGHRTVDMRSWNFRALRVLNLQHRNRTDVLRWLDRAQRMSARGVLNPGRLVDSFVALEDFHDVLHADPRTSDVVKSALRPGAPLSTSGYPTGTDSNLS